MKSRVVSRHSRGREAVGQNVETEKGNGRSGTGNVAEASQRKVENTAEVKTSVGEGREREKTRSCMHSNPRGRLALLV